METAVGDQWRQLMETDGDRCWRPMETVNGD